MYEIIIMNEIFDKLGVDQTFTKQRYKKKRRKNVDPVEENHIKNVVPQKANVNFMIDTLFLPETKKGFKYLFVICDLSGNGHFDIEETKDLQQITSLKALKNCLKRKYIKVDKNTFTVASDNGNEWTGVFHQWLWDQNIFHKKTLAGKHSQNSTVESLNKQLARIFNAYMNKMEEETKKVYKEWDEIVPTVRRLLNNYRKKALPKNPEYPAYDLTVEKTHTIMVKGKKKEITYNELPKPKFAVGDEVHLLLWKPKDALGRNQNTENFRAGDYTVEKKIREIEQILYFPDEPKIRYLVSGMKKASFSEQELRRPSDL